MLTAWYRVRRTPRPASQGACLLDVHIEKGFVILPAFQHHSVSSSPTFNAAFVALHGTSQQTGEIKASDGRGLRGLRLVFLRRRAPVYLAAHPSEIDGGYSGESRGSTGRETGCDAIDARQESPPRVAGCRSVRACQQIPRKGEAATTLQSASARQSAIM